MISLILPYWNRQKATDRAFESLSRHYRDVEIVVVDDGSPTPFVPPQTHLKVVTVRLPTKSEAKNPCLPFNVGGVVSKGEYIAISNPEIIHPTPVLYAMEDELKKLGPKGYVLAACWCPEQRRWHCHSTREHANDNDVGSFIPKGAGYHFLSMMHRSLWDEVRGFDEDYRDGAGYDDPDFVLRLNKVGAQFRIRDDLIVLHTRDGAKSAWPVGAHERNRKIFFEKWSKCWSQMSA